MNCLYKRPSCKPCCKESPRKCTSSTCTSRSLSPCHPGPKQPVVCSRACSPCPSWEIRKCRPCIKKNVAMNTCVPSYEADTFNSAMRKVDKYTCGNEDCPSFPVCTHAMDCPACYTKPKAQCYYPPGTPEPTCKTNCNLPLNIPCERPSCTYVRPCKPKQAPCLPKVMPCKPCSSCSPCQNPCMGPPCKPYQNPCMQPPCNYYGPCQNPCIRPCSFCRRICSKPSLPCSRCDRYRFCRPSYSCRHGYPCFSKYSCFSKYPCEPARPCSSCFSIRKPVCKKPVCNPCKPKLCVKKKPYGCGCGITNYQKISIKVNAPDCVSKKSCLRLKSTDSVCLSNTPKCIKNLFTKCNDCGKFKLQKNEAPKAITCPKKPCIVDIKPSPPCPGGCKYKISSCPDVLGPYPLMRIPKIKVDANQPHVEMGFQGTPRRKCGKF